MPIWKVSYTRDGKREHFFYDSNNREADILEAYEVILDELNLPRDRSKTPGDIVAGQDISEVNIDEAREEEIHPSE